MQLSEADFKGVETWTFDEELIYSHEAWRGRIRASASVAGSLDTNAVLRFDEITSNSSV